jgi:DNA-binding protein HU-beta
MSMTKTAMLSTLADKTGLQKKEVQTVLDALASLAYAEAKHGFAVPGLGKLRLVDRAARTGRNPATGETIQIPAKKVVKFSISKACKEAILG